MFVCIQSVIDESFAFRRVKVAYDNLTGRGGNLVGREPRTFEMYVISDNHNTIDSVNFVQLITPNI